jgi:hypothetical protein
MARPLEGRPDERRGASSTLDLMNAGARFRAPEVHRGVWGGQGSVEPPYIFQ